MASTAVTSKYERAIQVYNWFKTARLNVLYYEHSLRNWTRAVKTHDTVIALTGASSPIAFWQHSPAPFYHQAWFYLTAFAGISAVLKPVFHWDKQLILFSELKTQYCELYMDLKYLAEDIAFARDIDEEANARFEYCRAKFKTLSGKEPPQNDPKTLRIQKRVNVEININDFWFPPEK
jgi:hypothetical protein